MKDLSTTGRSATRTPTHTDPQTETSSAES